MNLSASPCDFLVVLNLKQFSAVLRSMNLYSQPLYFKSDEMQCF